MALATPLVGIRGRRPVQEPSFVFNYLLGYQACREGCISLIPKLISPNCLRRHALCRNPGGSVGAGAILCFQPLVGIASLRLKPYIAHSKADIYRLRVILGFVRRWKFLM